MRFRVNVNDFNVDLSLRESTINTGGPQFIGEEPATPKLFADAFLKSLRGWEGLKGEGEANRARAPIGQDMKEVLRRLGYGEIAATADYSRIEGSYRSGLPKGGNQGVDEWRYDEMVASELKPGDGKL